MASTRVDVVDLDVRVYTGIGSRRAPDRILTLCMLIAGTMRTLGWTCRSGHAEGCDQAFENGADDAAQVFLPWASFNKDVPVLGRKFVEPTEAAYAVAAQFHPAWDRLPQGVRKLQARNVHQVLGYDLASPTEMVICWTPDGSLDGAGPNTGGTGQALRIAAKHDIEVINLQRASHYDRVLGGLKLSSRENPPW